MSKISRRSFFRLAGAAAATAVAPISAVANFIREPLGGWILCDGRLVNRSKYVELYNIIGTTYGKGDGSTTFNLPDLRRSYTNFPVKLDSKPLIIEPFIKIRKDENDLFPIGSVMEKLKIERPQNATQASVN